MDDVSPIMRMPAVVAATGLCKRTIHYMVSRKEFPAPIQLGKRAVGWRQSAIQAWLEARRGTNG